MQSSFFAELIRDYPEIAALVTLVIGLVAARIASVAVGRGLMVLDERLARYSVSGRSLIAPPLVSFGKGFTFWLVTAISFVWALIIMDVAQFNLALDQMFVFLGRLVLGVTIVGIGHLLGLLARSAIARVTEETAAPGAIPRLVHGGVVLVAVVTALAQLNIDTTFITQLLLVLISVTFGALALAFAFGARQQVANLLARNELGRFSVGERIRIGEDEGDIVDIYATGLDIATRDGISSIPASHFTRLTVHRLGRKDD